MLCAAIHSASRAEGQDQNELRQRQGLAAELNIPASALETERGRMLADRLRFLLRSKGSLGPKHPSYKAMEEEIRSIRDQLGVTISIDDLAAMNGEQLQMTYNKLQLRFLPLAT